MNDPTHYRVFQNTYAVRVLEKNDQGSYLSAGDGTPFFIDETTIEEECHFIRWVTEWVPLEKQL